MRSYTAPMRNFCMLLPMVLLGLGCETPVRPIVPGEGYTPVLNETFSRQQALPDEFLTLNGEVTITGTPNRFAQLPAEPLEAHGLMFGPAMVDGLRVAARFQGEAKGRQAPSFGVGLNGMSGYRLVVKPAEDKLLMLRNETTVAEAEYQWSPGQWTYLQLQLRPLPGLQWAVEGKAWADTQLEPTDWTLIWKEADKPLAGRPTVWGTPFSGQPIAVDDLRVWRID